MNDQASGFNVKVKQSYLSKYNDNNNDNNSKNDEM